MKPTKPKIIAKKFSEKYCPLNHRHYVCRTIANRTRINALLNTLHTMKRTVSNNSVQLTGHVTATVDGFKVHESLRKTSRAVYESQSAKTGKANKTQRAESRRDSAPCSAMRDAAKYNRADKQREDRRAKRRK